MALQRLPNDVQSMLCASARVNSYKRTIEELIYNSLDAKSTSIAIRIHIQENTIQVIDNGNGITKDDFSVIGQRYMTSKLPDVATLKAAPKNYGFRGEFLTNIITVSQMVKVTSRHDSTEDTWAKTFTNGKESKFTQMKTRPTKGTTVDIKGFLYNLNIQKRAIDSINELQNIKSFLEQLSLVHNHISLSLRDDSQNEIIFKIHKKRDIYQTLSSLFNIDKLDILELQVQKDEYKVKGLIGKTNKNLDLHWIYLNGKCMYNCSKLHKVLNEYFKRSLHIKDQKLLKSKKQYIDEYLLLNQNIPLYFVFITCPYIDYDISYTPKQSVVEFKKWEKINKLLEKLVKFYAGDVNVKEIKKVEDKLMNKEQINNKVNQDTRDQVKKIMDKILGSNSKKLGASQLQNGIKGKMVKRKVKKKAKRSVIIPTLFLQNDNKCNNDDHASTNCKTVLIPEHNFEQQIIQETVDDLDKNKENNVLENPRKNNKQIKVHNPKKCKTKEILKHKKKNKMQANILSPAKKKYRKIMKQKQTLNKDKQVNFNYNKFECLKSTDSVCKRSKIVAQKVENFLKNHTEETNVNIRQLEKSKKNTVFLQRNFFAINDNKRLPLKTNKQVIEKYIMNKLKTKSYKTTYDLVQTVLNSQQDMLNAAENNISEEFYNNFHRRQDTKPCLPTVPKQYTWTNRYICNGYSDNVAQKERLQYTTDISAEYKTYEYEGNFSFYEQRNNISDIMTNVSEQMKFIDKEENIYSQNHICCAQKDTFCRSFSGPLRVLTYDSHQYHKKEVLIRNDTGNCHAINQKQNVRVITKESRDNFGTSNVFTNRLKKLVKTVSKKKQEKVFDLHIQQTIDESLYTIEYSKSNENKYNTAHNDILPSRGDFISGKDYYKHTTVDNEPVTTNNDFKTVFGNTYTIHPSNSLLNKNITTENRTQTQNVQFTKQFETYSVQDSFSEGNDDYNESKTTKDQFDHNCKNFNIVFVSKSRSETDTSLGNMKIIEPLNVCETVFYEIGSDEKEFAVSFNENNRLNDSLYDNFRNINETEHAIPDNDDIITENVSHHFSCVVKPTQLQFINNINDDNFQDPMLMENNHTEITNNIFRTVNLPDYSTEGHSNTENIDCNFEINFNFKNRPRFVPKGMSQIFENCRATTASDSNMGEDYYEESIYNNFANDVQVNSEIYEPIIQNIEDLTTKDIHKFQTKVKKDNASLVFDESSLKEAKVLGQADCKFIVAIMKTRCNQSKEGSEYLILFDQHAVHERIRLEKNLADYLKEEIWTSVVVDDIVLKMSKDEILYLHNYKDKFTQLGLQWAILNDHEVSVHSIPEAILGKNPREVEKVIKAVRNLIVEEINVIKLQKGCVSLYPKSIMDLVFSESCRYAIKFGDTLLKSDCVELLNALSECKTPFQCAHGRPVMAVIMDIITDKREYKINMATLRRFRQRIRRNLQNKYNNNKLKHQIG